MKLKETRAGNSGFGANRTETIATQAIAQQQTTGNSFNVYI